jgi:ubiquinone biosynthesis protein UbiJ
MLSSARQFFANTLEKAINTWLGLDAESSVQLHKLAGKIVAIRLTGTGLHFNLVFLAHKVQVDMDDLLVADTTITGTPLRLLHLSFAPVKQRQHFFADDVSITGNLDLGQQVIDLFDRLDIDWEEITARFVGDVPAHHIGKLVKKVKEFTQQTQQVMTQQVSEFIHEEIPLFPPVEALKDFFQEIDTVRLDADRLEARIKRLQDNVARGGGQ